MKTATALALLFFLAVSPASAFERKNPAGRMEQLLEERRRLSAEYANKEKELSKLTVRLHEIDDEMQKIRQQAR